jgi:hypothetical protein
MALRAPDRRLGLLCALALVAGALATPATAVESMTVKLDEAVLVKLPDHVATIVVGNPLIADAAPQVGGVLVITGKGFGSTNVIALDHTGTVLLERQVEVTAPGMVVVFRGIERETYACTPRCERKPVLGDEAVYYDTLMKQAQSRNDAAVGVSQTLGVAH